MRRKFYMVIDTDDKVRWKRGGTAHEESGCALRRIIRITPTKVKVLRKILA
jgi:hypothetical protein